MLHIAGLMHVTRFIVFAVLLLLGLSGLILEKIWRRTAADRAPYDQLFQSGFGAFETHVTLAICGSTLEDGRKIKLICCFKGASIADSCYHMDIHANNGSQRSTLCCTHDCILSTSRGDRTLQFNKFCRDQSADIISVPPV